MSFYCSRVLEHNAERLIQIFCDAEHHFTTWLQDALFEFGHVRTFDPNLSGHMCFGDAFSRPPLCDRVRNHWIGL